MRSLDKYRHRSSAAPNIEHPQSAFDLRLFDQWLLRLVRAQDPQERIVQRKQPALSQGRDVISLGVIHRSGCRHHSLLHLPAPRYRTGMAVSTATPRLSSIRKARALGRDETISFSRLLTKCGAVIERERRGESALDQSHQHRPPLFLAIVMRTARAMHESETVVEAAKRHTERIRHAVFEPANCTRADSRHHDARVPRRPQGLVESMQAPHCEHVRAAAAADVDDVLIHHERFEVANVSLEESKMRRGGARRRKRFMEAPDVGVAVAARCPDEAYARTPAPREAQHKIIERRISRVHRETPATHRRDMPLRHPHPLANSHADSFAATRAFEFELICNTELKVKM